MTALWMLYALVVGTLLAITARALEGALRAAVLPVRWVWAGALVATVLLVAAAPHRAAPAPAVQVVEVRQVPVGTPAAEAPSPRSPVATLVSVLREAGDVPLQRAAALIETGSVGRLDRVLGGAWILLSLLLALLFPATLLRFRAAGRSWPVARLHGSRVRISPRAGPAVVGVLRSEIVIPRWLLTSHPEEQRLVLAHEQEHQRARDPLLLATGCLAAVLLPWHPAVWWMLSRLRLAVELDCDARVLRRGVAPLSYGSMLIDLAGRCSGLPVGAPALADTPSHLERRLLAMKPETRPFGPARAAALGAFALATVLVACDTALPTAAQVEEMDAAAAETQARRIALINPGDAEEAVFMVDGVVVSREEAHAIAADRIAHIEVLRSTGGEAARIQISTEEEGAEGIRIRAVRSEEGAEGARLRVSEPGRLVVGGASDFQGVILIDGVRADGTALRALRPEEIQGIEVIKGPAAAKTFDAPEAEHGVIRVTTKRGAVND